MVGEVVRNCVPGKVFAGHALTLKKDVLALETARQVALTDDPRRHIPIERSGGSVRLLDAVAVRVIGVSISGGPGDSVFLVVRLVDIRRGIARHIAGGV